MKQSVHQILDFFKKHKYGKLSLLVLLAGLVFSSTMILQSKPKEEPVALSEVAAAISAGEVEKIEDAQDKGELTIYYADGSQDTALKDKAAPFLEQMRYLEVNESRLTKLKYEVIAPNAITGEKVISGIISFSILGLAGFAMVKFSGGGLMAMRKKYEEGVIPDTTFKDVAGVDECREELADIVTFLKGNGQYQRMGARMPRGVLLVGDPGTGKTLLAKAIAGEAGVPFFATSGSEFVEMFVGVGAGRVRTLFKKARSKAPCIVFIDEIDAVGRKRHASSGGGEMEQDQTLNQLLVEMDGFTPAEGVVVLAATNRTDVLDPALTRSGRFDRHVNIPHPDIMGRLSILQVHVDGRSLATDVNLMDVAKSTPGLVGADLANVVNEAAIQAVRNNHEAITMRDFQEAVEKGSHGRCGAEKPGNQGRRTTNDRLSRGRACSGDARHPSLRPGLQDHDHSKGPGGRLHHVAPRAGQPAYVPQPDAGAHHRPDGRTRRRGTILRRHHQRRCQRFKGCHTNG